MKMVRMRAVTKDDGKQSEELSFVLLCGVDYEERLADGQWMGYIKYENDEVYPFIMNKGKHLLYGTESGYTEWANLYNKEIRVGELFTVASSMEEGEDWVMTFEITSCHSLSTGGEFRDGDYPLINKTGVGKRTRLMPDLIAVPVGDYLKRPSFSKKRIGGVASVGQPLKFPANPSIVLAMDALRSVITLTIHLIADGPQSHVAPINKALDAINETLRLLEDSLRNDCPDGILTIHTGGVADLCKHTSFVMDITYQFDEQSAQLSNLVKFWLVEIERRIQELFNICIRSTDCIEAERVFKTIRGIRYPLE